jgi:hypothetical protein
MPTAIAVSPVTTHLGEDFLAFITEPVVKIMSDEFLEFFSSLCPRK